MTTTPQSPGATPETAVPPPGPVLRHRGFQYLLAGAGASHIGTQIRLVALPLIAVTTFHVTPFQSGLLTAAETAAFLLIGLPAGVWADRFRRRRILIAADIARGLVILSLPVASFLGVLSLPHLYVVALLVGFGTVLFDVAHMSYVPQLVGRKRVVEAATRLEVVEFSATAGGPAAAGLLVQYLTAPFTLLVNAFSYAVSALFLSRIRDDGKSPRADAAPGEPSRMWPDIKAGLAVVLRDPVLRPIALCGAVVQLFETGWLALQPIFLIRQIGLSSGGYGVLLAAGAIGGLLGAVLTPPICRRFGTVRTLRISLLMTFPFLLLPFAAPGWQTVLYGIGTFLGMGASAIYNVTQIGIRQLACPEHLLGRMNATMRFVMWGVMPFGGILGGALGSLFGVRAALTVCLAGLLLAAVPIWLSSLRTMSDQGLAHA
ncbi:MFS transporter [Streptomyces sp. NPDC058220]|uniref:MFS transporter n=1 Tax=Streptomyces sp. NPDC058220 TaxID=3346387 RepID=UPI0036EB11D7